CWRLVDRLKVRCRRCRAADARKSFRWSRQTVATRPLG
ncbi:MAG: hypothetical protein AVDCRST_MAG14-2500, partial [uncultured Rubrobacteraceae bacterium]